jgi:Holliday junction resolvasome RuvABC DNA-binding subunit
LRLIYQIRDVPAGDRERYSARGATTSVCSRLNLRIQHVGSKIALAILSVLAPKDLLAAISHKDVEGIDAVPGVGAKVAKRIVRALRNKIGERNLAAPAQTFSASSNGHAGKAR